MGTNHKRRTAFVLLALLTLCVLGCKYRQFKIVMSFDDKSGVVREIEVSLSTGNYNDSDLSKDSMVTRINEIYGPPVSTNPDSNSRTYRKSFSGKLPQEIEHCGFISSGSISESESPLGRSIVYRERMPGPTRWKEINDLLNKAVDMHIRALVAGLENDPELKGRPEELKRLTEFIRTTFCTDVTDCVLECWLGYIQDEAALGSAGSDRQRNGVLGPVLDRAAQLLWERGYFTKIGDGEFDDGRNLLRAILDRFVREMGASATTKRPRIFTEWLHDEGSSDKFIEAGFAITGESTEELEDATGRLFPARWGDSTAGMVTWKMKSEPIASNGKWDNSVRELSWNCDIKNGPIPAQLLWASWAEPDEKFQRRHLGCVLIRKELGRYNQWYLALDPAMKKEWDRFVLSLPGDASLAKQLKAFEFTGRPRDRNVPPENVIGVSDPYSGVGMILSALKDAPPIPPPASSQPVDDGR